MSDCNWRKLSAAWWRQLADCASHVAARIEDLERSPTCTDRALDDGETT